MPSNLREGPLEINAAGARIARPGDVRRALDDLRPGLMADGGNVELRSVTEDGTVRVVLQGACATCPSREATRLLLLQPWLRKQVPGVTSVLIESA
jgi:Fe-S cluster biogenesis protein NfuA